MRRTRAPAAVAVGVIVMAPLLTGWSKSTRSHCPTAACSALDTHAVAESPSMAAAGEGARATSGIAVEYDAAPRTGVPPAVPRAEHRVAAGNGIVGHPVVGVPCVAGRPDRGRMFVDPAVVGLAGH